VFVVFTFCRPYVERNGRRFENPADQRSLYASPRG
jgi:hypothetical protein